MQVKAIKTSPVESGNNLLELIDRSIPTLAEGSIVAVTSKIVAITEGAIVPVTETNKDELITQEADYYLPRALSKYNTMLTIKNNILIPAAGIDESNGHGNYILWPKNPQATANVIRQFLRTKHGLKDCGVIITDSKTSILRWGTTGVTIGYSGFRPLHDYIGQPDIYGQLLKMTKSNTIEGLAAAAVLCMGEGNEQTPLALITEASFVEFTDADPTQEELESLKIDLVDDLYAPLLESVDWIKSKGG